MGREKVLKEGAEGGEKDEKGEKLDVGEEFESGDGFKFIGEYDAKQDDKSVGNHRAFPTFFLC